MPSKVCRLQKHSLFFYFFYSNGMIIDLKCNIRTFFKKMQ